MTVKLSDWIFRFLAEQGVKHVFMLTGGGAMHLNDSLGMRQDIEYVCVSHEQAAAMAAESYAKVVDDIGVCLVTAGPGATNAITGVAGAWLDSTPMLVLSGQAKRADLKGNSGVRQMGVQEVDIVSMVSPITKYAVTVMEPADIRYHLEKAVHLARTGRPGPVWLDLPLDVQGAPIEEDTLRAYDPAEDAVTGLASADDLAAAAARTIDLLNAAERPVVLIGNGVRLGRAREEMRALIERLGVPVLTTWPAHDMVPDDHPLMVGRPGPLAPRGANFTLQNSDWLLALGARLDLVVTGYAPQNFARAAKKIMVDIDAAELRKMRGTIDVPVHADVKDFILEMTRQLDRVKPRDRSDWDARWRGWQTKYPVVLPEYRNLPDGVSIYVLGEAISEASAPDDVIVSGSSGSAIEVFCLAARLKEGQRLFLTTALGAMGNGLPGVIGACLGERAAPHDLRRRRRRAAAQHPGARDDAAAEPADQALRHEQRRLRVDPDVAVALLRPPRRGRLDERGDAPVAAQGGGSVRASLRQDRERSRSRRPDPRAARRAGPGGRRGDDAAGRAAGAEPVVDEETGRLDGVEAARGSRAVPAARRVPGEHGHPAGRRGLSASPHA